MTKRPPATLPPNLWGAGALALLLLSGCSQFEPYQRADMALPGNWATAPSAGERTTSTAPAAAPLPWQGFVKHAPLQALIEQALQHNLDARLAQRQMAQLQAQWQQRQAAQAPALHAAAQSQLHGNADGAAPANRYQAGLQVANWELDFFGRLQSLSEAARAQYLASAEAERFVRVSLVAGVIEAWLQVQSAHALLEVTQRTVANHEASVRLVQLRLQHGTASALQRQHSEVQLQAARVAQARQQRQLQLALHQLQQLVGPLHDPAASTPAPLPSGTDALALLQAVAVGLPSEVLLLRPDVQAAENRLAAAQAQIGAARAAFFPRISLTAQLGSASTELAGLFAGGSWGWTLAPQALLPLLDQGANRAGLAAAEAERDIARLQYEQAIQTAFREVRDALASQAFLQSEYAAQQALWQAESQRTQLSGRLLALGSASQLELLDTQRSAFAAEQQLVQLRFALLHNRLALYRATGGH